MLLCVCVFFYLLHTEYLFYYQSEDIGWSSQPQRPVGPGLGFRSGLRCSGSVRVINGANESPGSSVKCWLTQQT